MTPTPARARTRTGKKTSRPIEFDVAAAKRRLRKVGTEIERIEDVRPGLYEERLDLWKKLTDAGVDRTELATLAKTTPGAMKFAIHADKRRKESTPPG